MNGETLRDRLQAKRIKLKDIAESMGITGQALSSRFTVNEVKYSFLEQIAEITKLPIDYLLNGDISFFNNNGNQIVGNGNITHHLADIAKDKEIEHLKEIIKEKDKRICVLEELLEMYKLK